MSSASPNASIFSFGKARGSFSSSTGTGAKTLSRQPKHQLDPPVEKALRFAKHKGFSKDLSPLRAGEGTKGHMR